MRSLRPFERQFLRAGRAGHGPRMLAEETPVALSFNGVTHAVMMATPSHIRDLGIGLALNERIVTRPDEIERMEIVDSDLGMPRDLNGDGPRQADGYARRLYGFLSTYVTVYRDAYVEGVRLARESCDLVVDGLRTVDELVEEITLAARVARRATEQLNP